MRPLSPDEVFDRPEEMVILMSMPPVGGKRRPPEGPVHGPAVPKLPPHMTQPETPPTAGDDPGDDNPQSPPPEQ